MEQAGGFPQATDSEAKEMRQGLIKPLFEMAYGTVSQNFIAYQMNALKDRLDAQAKGVLPNGGNTVLK